MLRPPRLSLTLTKLTRATLETAELFGSFSGLGRNVEAPEERIRSVNDATRFREKMTAATVDRIEQIARETGKPVAAPYR